MSTPNNGRRLSPYEIETVIRLYLEGELNQTQIAEELDCEVKTVARHIKRYRQRHNAAFVEDTAAEYKDFVARLWRIAEEASIASHDSNLSDRAREDASRRELMAMTQIAKTRGFDAPMKVEHSGKGGGPVEVLLMIDEEIEKYRQLLDVTPEDEEE